MSRPPSPPCRPNSGRPGAPPPRVRAARSQALACVQAHPCGGWCRSMLTPTKHPDGYMCLSSFSGSRHLSLFCQVKLHDHALGMKF